MIYATPKMIDRLHDETGLLVRHVTEAEDETLRVTRMNHIHIYVEIPKTTWPLYRTANVDNFISPGLRAIDDTYIERVLQIVKDGKYGLSDQVINLIMADKEYTYTVNPEEGQLVVTTGVVQHTFEITKIFKGIGLDYDYINAIVE